MKQNITLSVEKSLLKKARILAAQKQTSISKIIGDELSRIIDQTEQYEFAHRKALANLDRGFYWGNPKVKREVLHDR